MTKIIKNLKKLLKILKNYLKNNHKNCLKTNFKIL